jgi:hypothetical protein
MKRLLTLILFTVVAVASSEFLLPETRAASFYVALDGSDTAGNGSSSSPWRTIDHAITHVPDGSTILVRLGTYNGRVNLRGSFTEGVVVRSEFPYLAALRNTDRVVTIYEGQGITLEGFDIAHTGAGSISVEVRENFTGRARQGAVMVAGYNLILFQDGGMGEQCNTTVSPSFASFPATSQLGGIMAGDVNVFTDDGCAWEAQSNASWIIVGDFAGIGRGSVVYGVQNNTTGQARKGTITVAGKTFSVKQRGK